MCQGANTVRERKCPRRFDGNARPGNAGTVGLRLDAEEIDAAVSKAQLLGLRC